jgi:hypothetical protein
MSLELSWLIFEDTEISDFVMIHPVGAKLCHAAGEPGGRDANSRFPPFCERAYKKDLLNCTRPARVVTNPRDCFVWIRNRRELKWKFCFGSIQCISTRAFIHQ